MKPSSNPEKGQRSIASFFFKPKAGPAPKNGQQKQQQRVLGEKQAAQGPPLAAPSKRQRVSPPESHRQEDAVPRNMSSSPALHTQAPENSAVQLQAAASSKAQSARAPQAPSMQPASAGIQSHPTQVPARVEQRHQRFQQKLVIGAGNKPEAHSKAMPAVTKPKYTPLELQIVDLKDRHPGVLLIVEVTTSSCANVANCHNAHQPFCWFGCNQTHSLSYQLQCDTAGWVQNALFRGRCRYVLVELIPVLPPARPLCMQNQKCPV